MKKAMLLMCALLLFGVVSASARGGGDWSTIQKKGVYANWDVVKPTSVYSPRSMGGTYALGRWVQFVDGKLVLASKQNKGFSHRLNRFDMDRDSDLSKLLCNSQTSCAYTIDMMGEIDFNPPNSKRTQTE